LWSSPSENDVLSIELCQDRRVIRKAGDKVEHCNVIDEAEEREDVFSRVGVGKFVILSNFTGSASIPFDEI